MALTQYRRPTADDRRLTTDQRPTTNEPFDTAVPEPGSPEWERRVEGQGRQRPTTTNARWLSSAVYSLLALLILLATPIVLAAPGQVAAQTRPPAGALDASN